MQYVCADASFDGHCGVCGDDAKAFSSKSLHMDNASVVLVISTAISNHQCQFDTILSEKYIVAAR